MAEKLIKQINIGGEVYTIKDEACRNTASTNAQNITALDTAVSTINTEITNIKNGPTIVNKAIYYDNSENSKKLPGTIAYRIELADKKIDDNAKALESLQTAFEGRNRAEVFNYSSDVVSKLHRLSDINYDNSEGKYEIGDILFIKEDDVPDVWISDINYGENYDDGLTNGFTKDDFKNQSDDDSFYTLRIGIFELMIFESTVDFTEIDSMKESLTAIGTSVDENWQDIRDFESGTFPVGWATKAGKLIVPDGGVGSATNPVYFNAEGKPVKTTYTLEKSVPSDAKFTDTTYGIVTTSANGLMSSTDKVKLNGIEQNAKANVQSDWNEKLETSDAFIKNKPTTFPPSAHTGFHDNEYWKRTETVSTSNFTNNCVSGGTLDTRIKTIENKTITASYANEELTISFG